MADIAGFFEEDERRYEKRDENEGNCQVRGLIFEQSPCLPWRLEFIRRGRF